MKNDLEKKESRKLTLNGRFIPTAIVEGKTYIAIKPICEVLNVDFEVQRVRIQNDKILCQLPLLTGVVAADGRKREMLCLPEKFVYGWLFSITRSDSEELWEYKKTCYEVLFNHFHGAFTERISTLAEQSKIDAEIQRLEQELMKTPQAQKIQELKRKKSAGNGHLKKLDREIMDTQLSIFEDN